MHLAAVEIRLIRPPGVTFQYVDYMPPVAVDGIIVTLTTADGAVGRSMCFSFGDGMPLAATLATRLKPLLPGRDPLEREAIWSDLVQKARFFIPAMAVGAIDNALWDLAARQAGLPLYRFLGAARRSVPAYASSPSFPDTAGYLAWAESARAAGFQAMKLHATGDPGRDVAICREVRRHVGDAPALMLDPVGAYDLAAATRVGRALEDFDYLWLEEPMPETHLGQYAELCRRLNIQVAGGETLWLGSTQLADALVLGAFDLLRSDAVFSTGITSYRKAAAVCETFGRCCEIHSYGYSYAVATNLHAACSVRNCQYLEVPWPQAPWDYGVLNPLAIDGAGCYRPPVGAGVGIEFDWPAIEAATVGIW